MSIIYYILFFFGAFIIGSIPFGVLIPKLLGKGDPRIMGSKNIGASNVYRLGGFWCSFFVYLFDMMKGFLFIYLFIRFFTLSNEKTILLQWVSGFFVVMGHIFSIFLKGKGGKGIATASGVLLAMCPFIFLSGGILWLVVKKITNYASIASLTSVLFVFISLCISDFYYEGLPILPLILLLIFAHRDNIRRLLKREELSLKPS